MRWDGGQLVDVTDDEQRRVVRRRLRQRLHQPSTPVASVMRFAARPVGAHSNNSPDAVIYSPAEMTAAWPTMVTRSRWPRAFALRTQKPFSALWNVTRPALTRSKTARASLA
jgi:hypothetical protein